MSVKAIFTAQGIVLGDATENLDGTIQLKNPVLAIPQRDNMALVPFLSLMEEDSITVKPDQMQYGQIFTPTVDLRNHYNKLFGKIIEPSLGNILSLS